MMSKKRIWVTFQKEGLHKWPDATNYPGVEFLANEHRHMFHFRVSIEVFHDDREIEFIQFSRWLQRLFNEDVVQLDYKSCEMMSDDLYEKINEKYGGREVHIDISEDGENGAHIEYNT